MTKPYIRAAFPFLPACPPSVPIRAAIKQGNFIKLNKKKRRPPTYFRLACFCFLFCTIANQSFTSLTLTMKDLTIMSCFSMLQRSRHGCINGDDSSFISELPLLCEKQKQEEQPIHPLNTSKRIIELRKLMAEESVSQPCQLPYPLR